MTTCSLCVDRVSVVVFLGRRVPSRLRIPIRWRPVRLLLLGRRLTQMLSLGLGVMLSEALAQSAPVGCGAALRFSESVLVLICTCAVHSVRCVRTVLSPPPLFVPSSCLPLPPSPAPRRPRVLVSAMGFFGPWAGSLGRPLQALVLLWRCDPIGRLCGVLSPARSLPSLPHCGGQSFWSL